MNTDLQALRWLLSRHHRMDRARWLLHVEATLGRLRRAP